jgi:hypothetical protein
MRPGQRTRVTACLRRRPLALALGVILGVVAAGTAAATTKTTATIATSSASTGASTTPAGAVPPPQGSACGQTIDLPPRRSLGIGGAPLAIGDSVLYDAAQPLSAYGFHVNAMVCRTMAQGLAWLAAHQHALPVLVVVALGTNGGASGAQINELLSILGPHRFLALVTPHHGTDAATPALYRAAAQQAPDRIELLDWDRLSASHPAWFASDGIHLGGSAGIEAFAHLIASSLLGAVSPSAPVSPSTPSTTIQPTTIQPATPMPTARPKPARRAVRSGTADRAVKPPIDAAATALGVAEALCLSLAQGA